MARYKNLLTGKIRELTAEQYKRLFPLLHNGKVYDKAGWIEINDEPKKKESIEIIANSQKEEKPKVTRSRRKKD